MSTASNEDLDLLRSPLSESGFGRLFIIGGPIGLALAIAASLWVSYLHVRFTAVVQAPSAMVPGEPFTVRAQVVPEGAAKVPALVGAVWLERDGTRHELGPLVAVGETGVIQSALTAPGVEPGPATLHVEIRAASPGDMEPIFESVPVELSTVIPVTEAEPIVAGSTLQHGDDSDMQPPGVRIVVRPHGRLLSEFDNTLYVRVTKPDGTPWSGDVEVALISGVFAERSGSRADPPILAKGALDPWGITTVRGVLSSAVVRVQVRVLDGDGAVLHQRTLRMVSFAGGVVLRPESLVAPTSTPTIELRVDALRRNRPVYVDVHDARGSWISTITPLLRPRQPPHAWSVSSLAAGIVQFEAYTAPNAPGESTALARVQVLDGNPNQVDSLKPLIDAHRSALEVPRVEEGYDSALEDKYWTAVEPIDLSPAGVASARAFLLGTLPLSVYGPEVAVVNRDRVLAEMAAKKSWWTWVMRGVLLGGGGLFLLLMTVTMMRSHAKAAESTLEALARETETETDHVDASAEVKRARRAAFLRGLSVIAVMALALVGTTILLESLLWAH